MPKVHRLTRGTTWTDGARHTANGTSGRQPGSRTTNTSHRAYDWALVPHALDTVVQQRPGPRHGPLRAAAERQGAPAAPCCDRDGSSWHHHVCQPYQRYGRPDHIWRLAKGDGKAVTHDTMDTRGERHHVHERVSGEGGRGQ